MDTSILVFPSDVVDGTDTTVEDLADAVEFLAQSIRNDEGLHRGNIEWMTRWASLFMDALRANEDSMVESDIIRAEMRVELGPDENAFNYFYRS